MVPISEHINRLVACRAQADMLGSDLVLIARSDSEAATLITSTIDERDHAFILGSTNPDLAPLVDVLNSAQAKGASGKELGTLEAEWTKQASLMTFNEAVAQAIAAKGFRDGTARQYLSDAMGRSFHTAKRLAKQYVGEEVFFDSEASRSREGYYRYRGGCEAAINRAVAYAPYADMCWMESKTPDYGQAKQFADGVHDVWPEQKLAYNLSPSFNWMKAMPVEEQETYIERLGKLGYCWQFITLAGLHSSALIVDRFSQDFAKRGMRAYAEEIQRPEMDDGNEMVTHQKWSGANYIDDILKMVSGGMTSTAAMGEGVTETQFKRIGRWHLDKPQKAVVLSRKSCLRMTCWLYTRSEWWTWSDLDK